MVDEVAAGQRVPLPAAAASGPSTLAVTWPGAAAGTDVDATVLLLSARGKVEEESDLVFYNQPEAHGGAVRLAPGGVGDPGRTIALDLPRLPATVDRLLVVLTVDTAGRTFADVGAVTAELAAGGASLLRVRLDGFAAETALQLVELYRRDGGWRLRAAGDGFVAGLEAVIREYGSDRVQVTDEPAAPAPAPAAPKVDLLKAMPVDLAKRMAPRIDLAKRTADRLGVGDLVLRVGLVIDASGSMSRLYRDGVVAEVVERLAAVAMQLDDDGSMDVWQFAQSFVQLPPVTPATLDTYARDHVRLRVNEIGGVNNEPPAIADVVDHYVRRAPGPEPALVLFLSDGGVSKTKQIMAELIAASEHPLFWQFVGIGRANYGVLERLDTMEGRRVDNAGFFALDDVTAVTDAELYERLLTELPAYLTAARAAGILR